MSVRIFLNKTYTKRDSIILHIAAELFKKLSGIVIGLEAQETWDGANLRIIVRDDSAEIIDRIMEIVYAEIDRHNAYGEIIPEITKSRDLMFFSKAEAKPRRDIVDSIEKSLKRALPNVVVGVEAVETGDGANLRIIVRDDSAEIIDRIMEIVYAEIDRHNAYGEIIPEITKSGGDA